MFIRGNDLNLEKAVHDSMAQVMGYNEDLMKELILHMPLKEMYHYY